MKNQQPSSDGTRYHSDLAKMHRMEPIDFSNIERLLEESRLRNGNPPVQHFGVLGAKSEDHPDNPNSAEFGIPLQRDYQDGGLKEPRKMPVRSMGEVEIRATGKLRFAGGRLDRPSIQSQLSVNLHEMAAYEDKPKSQASGHDRINPHLDPGGWFWPEPKTENVFQPPQNTWQKFLTKVRLTWLRVKANFK
jgi:hypothetical protein